MAAITNED
jgi:ankyrin repeat protein